MNNWRCWSILCAALFCGAESMVAIGREPDQVLDIWPDLAPGESTREVGQPLARRADENPPATRIAGITRPQLHYFAAATSNERADSVAVLIFPGGGYNYVVADKEGSEVAQWLNGLGISAFVVHYRTKKSGAEEDGYWRRPVQDGQRAIRLIRSRAKELKIAADKIGIIGFSAGGNAAGLIATRFSQPEYVGQDQADSLSCRPDFAMLIYPWQLATPSGDGLNDLVTISRDTPPSFLVHAHDDRVTPLSSVYFYAGLKKNGVSGELHIFQNGGHGYGARPVADSDVSSWMDRASDWLHRRDLAMASNKR